MKMAEEWNLQLFSRGVDLGETEKFDFAIQDIYEDGTCPRIQTCWGSRSLAKLERCEPCVRSRFIIVCPGCARAGVYPLPYLPPLNKQKVEFFQEKFPISKQELWTVVEMSPMWPLLAKRVNGQHLPAQFSRRDLYSSSPRLHDMGGTHFLDLGEVQIGMFDAFLNVPERF